MEHTGEIEEIDSIGYAYNDIEDGEITVGTFGATVARVCGELGAFIDPDEGPDYDALPAFGVIAGRVATEADRSFGFTNGEGRSGQGSTVTETLYDLGTGFIPVDGKYNTPLTFGLNANVEYIWVRGTDYNLRVDSEAGTVEKVEIP